MTVADVQAAFARGVTAEALTQAFLDRIARYNPRYVAVITMNPDALHEAREIDRRRAAGEALGPLAGVPVVVKDTMDMAGLPSTGGWRDAERAGGRRRPDPGDGSARGGTDALRRRRHPGQDQCPGA